MSSALDPRDLARRLLVGIDDFVRTDLVEHTARALTDHFGIVVRMREPQQATDGRCGVDGSYQASNGAQPPVITVAASLSLRRRRFTGLHEFGHHRLIEDGAINDELWESGVADLDELIADAVAAQLLLPDSLVDQHILPAGPTGRSVLDLYDASLASRAACCVAAVQRLRRPGAVILARDGVAEFVAHHPGLPWRVARGTDQGHDSLVSQAGRTGHARGQTRMTFASGIQSDPLYADASASGDGWVLGVVTVDHPPWGGLQILDGDTGPEERQGECLHCDDSFTTYQGPCRSCGDLRCPTCNRCSCSSSVRERRCGGPCGLTRALSQYDGDSPICNDCS